MTIPTQTPAGWYDDGSGNQRYWDGEKWTDHTSPASVVTATSTAAAAQSPHVAPAKTQPNVLGIIALVLGIIGFIFAVMPGAFIIGWVALPIALILAVAALFLKNTGKGLAIAALIVAVVGTIAGFVAFFVTAANSFDEAFSSGEVTVSEPAQNDAVEEDPSADVPADAEVGTRENPVVLGTMISSDEWEVVINSVTLNATDAVLAANTFNEAPADGNAYAVANVTVTYIGEESSFAAMVGLDYVTATGEVISTWDNFAVAPEPTLDSGELYNGGSATGNIVFQIPASGDGSIRVTPGMFGDEVFVAVQ